MKHFVLFAALFVLVGCKCGGDSAEPTPSQSEWVDEVVTPEKFSVPEIPME